MKSYEKNIGPNNLQNNIDPKKSDIKDSSIIDMNFMIGCLPNNINFDTRNLTKL